MTPKRASNDGGPNGRDRASAPVAGGDPRWIGLDLSAGRVTRALAVVVLALLVANIGVQVARFGLGYPTALGLVDLFDFNTEENIPTFFSALLLLACGATFGLIASGVRRTGGRHPVLWTILAAALVFMAVDEAATIHELIGGKLMPLIEASGYLTHVWVIPYAGLAALVGLAGLRVVLSLPARIAALFVLGGALYLVGAIGMEMLGARHASLYGMENAGYAALYTIEELLEMTGVLVLIHAALVRLGLEYDGIGVRFAGAAPATPDVGVPREAPTRAAVR